MKKIMVGIWPVLIYFAVGLLIYSNTFQVPFYLDDSTSIVTNASLRHGWDLGRIASFWPTRFITYWTLALNYACHGLNIFGYHLVNILLHIATALVLRLLILRLMRALPTAASVTQERDDQIAFFAGLIFLMHPIQTQAVNYVVQRAVGLTAFFYFLSLTVFLKAQDLPGDRAREGKFWMALAVGAAVCAMYCKEIAISLPITAWLLRRFLGPPKNSVARVRNRWMFATAAIIPATFFLTRTFEFSKMARVSEGPTPISPVQYFVSQLPVIIGYIRLALWPQHQSFEHSFEVAGSFLEGRVLSAFLLLILILGLGFRWAWHHRSVIGFSLLWFLILLIPESSFFPIKDLMFEHRLYLPMAAFSLLLSTTVFAYVFPRRILIGTLVMGVLLTGYGYLTYTRNHLWRDPILLWTNAISESPNRPRPYNNRGLYYFSQGKQDLALKDYEKAIGLNPHHADALNNRGMLYHAQGEFDLAIQDYTAAIDSRPNFAVAYFNRGTAYKDWGHAEEALKDYSKALDLDPRLDDVLVNRGNLFAMRGQTAQALADYEDAIRLDSGRADVYVNRGLILEAMGRDDEAQEDYQRADALAP